VHSHSILCWSWDEGWHGEDGRREECTAIQWAGVHTKYKREVRERVCCAQKSVQLYVRGACAVATCELTYVEADVYRKVCGVERGWSQCVIHLQLFETTKCCWCHIEVGVQSYNFFVTRDRGIESSLSTGQQPRCSGGGRGPGRLGAGPGRTRWIRQSANPQKVIPTQFQSTDTSFDRSLDCLPWT
jgi:hypothetical protein